MKMKKVKTSELSGVDLDRAVMMIEGLDGYFYPSENWDDCGPIIEREWLQLTPWPNESDEDKRWHCVQHDTPVQWHAYGPTPLIAAMRCYVASEMGDEVEVPMNLWDEILEEKGE